MGPRNLSRSTAHHPAEGRRLLQNWSLGSVVRRVWTLIAVSTLIAGATSAAPVDTTAQGRQALVVGISHYTHWPALPGAITDAREIAWLFEQNGFAVTLLTDPTGAALKASLSRLTQSPGRETNHTVVIFYAGRALTEQQADGPQVGWLIPSDCPSRQTSPDQFKEKAISTAQLNTLSEKIPARQALMLFDASFAGDQFHLKKPVLRLPGATAGQPIRQFIIAGEAYQPDSERSAFTGHLIRGLTGEADALRDGTITGSELGVYLYQQLLRTGRHVQYALSRNPDLAKGDMALSQFRRPADSARLYVDPQPTDATVRILNIRPTFHQGIDLEPGRYQISVSADGYRTDTRWIALEAGTVQSLSMVLAAAKTEITNSLGMHFRWIDAGSYTMGTDDQDTLELDETAHTVHLTQGFFIQSTEVTIEQFQLFVRATGHRSDAAKSGCWTADGQRRWKNDETVDWRTLNRKRRGDASKNLPATCISWNDAQAFVRWLSAKEDKTYQLPTEAQWEYACRADTRTAFSVGPCLTTRQARFDNTGNAFRSCEKEKGSRPDGPAVVATLKSNPWGVYDMHGNVAEWCLDWYGPYPNSRVRDPKGAYPGVEKVIRGGHFNSRANECRSARRLSFPPSAASEAIGFRVVMQP